MSVRNLQYLFAPTSVAVIGASARPNSIGNLVMQNLLGAGFAGPIMPVNPKHRAIAGVLAYPDIGRLPMTPDMAMICIPPQGIPDAIRSLAEKGCKAAIVLTAGLDFVPDGAEQTIKQQMLDIAQQHQFRLLGPNCIGLLVPGIGLNASFAHMSALKGRIGFVAQSGAFCTAVLDWAKPRGIGFSHFVSMGEMADTDFGDVIDYLGSDPDTDAILLYIESITDKRAFMSAARAAARNKPVLAIKTGRFEEGAKAAASHTGALAGADIVYDAAFRRAGMLRVHDFEELFAAVETLGRGHAAKGERLAIITNGGGLGVLAVDTLIERGGKLAQLSEDTIAKLDKILPATWSKANPVDIIGDAPGQRYIDGLEILLNADEVDAVLCMHAPVSVVPPTEVADAVIDMANRYPDAAINTCFVGGEAIAPARKKIMEADLPAFDTPSKAVQAFMHRVQYQRNQELLLETPPSMPAEFQPNIALVRDILDNAMKDGTETLSEPDAKAIFAAYGIPTVKTLVATSVEDAINKAEDCGYPVVLKILSPAISHKSDVGGVALDLHGPEEVQKAATDMLARTRAIKGDIPVTGFTVQSMARRPGAHELIVGAMSDPIFGPVILFGDGGTAVEVIADRAVALPPLNMALAGDMVKQTRIYKLLKGYRDRPAADLDAISLVLNRISQLIIDMPEIAELDINPLFADEHGVLAVDARIRVAHTKEQGTDRLAIRPWPQELAGSFTMKCGHDADIRPIRPEDEAAQRDFLERLTEDDIRFPFFGLVTRPEHSQLARLSQIDYDREMAFIAVGRDGSEAGNILGIVRSVASRNNDIAEFSIVVRSDLKGNGLAHELMRRIIDWSRDRGTQSLIGQVPATNDRMLTFVRRLGFALEAPSKDNVIQIRLRLTDAQES